MRNYTTASRVEEIALQQSGRNPRYAPVEKLDIIEVSDFPTLGKLAALRFLEWLQLNPEGVISLPTGKTPEHFISWTMRYLAGWNRKDIRGELAGWGLDPDKKPAMRSFSFVQIDEFYPMDPKQENSFGHYIRRFYLDGFGLDPAKALLMDTWETGAPVGKTLDAVFPGEKVDLSLRHRQPANERELLQYRAITAADQAAMEYEEKIAAAGGIGFFLGGIGPDGHIGFNIRGSDHFSATRLIPINYETAAAAAGDLGGIEISRHKVVLTVGLKTVTRNPTATAVIIAAGESKAQVVRDAVENPPSVLYPATALQALPAARFYLTKGAARRLLERRCIDLAAQEKISPAAVERVCVDIAYRKKKRLIELEAEDLAGDRLGAILLARQPDIEPFTAAIISDLKQRIARGREDITGATFLHTAPHHDDIMLGYLPYIVHLVRNPANAHYFATLTSGFTSVTNAYTASLLRNLEEFLAGGVLTPLIREAYFAPGNLISRNRDVYQYLDGVAAGSADMQREAEARRMLRVITELTGKDEEKSLRKETAKLKDYFTAVYPGKKDTPLVQTLKGMIREWEEELLWGHLGFHCDHIFHLRLGFYTGDIFTPEPEYGRDVEPILDLLGKVNPDIVTVALDPEGSGPDTHYKVLQAIAEALKTFTKKSKKSVRVWGYRNVWYRFHPSEANVFVPVSMNSLAIMKSAFAACFSSQRSASFPSHEYDGPFSDLAQKIMVEQYAVIKTCLGRDFFYNNPVPRLRATRGLNFLREMTCDEFFAEARALKERTESPKA